MLGTLPPEMPPDTRQVINIPDARYWTVEDAQTHRNPLFPGQAGYEDAPYEWVIVPGPTPPPRR